MLGDHLENYDDKWGIEKIKENMCILTIDRKKPYYGSGLSGIKLINRDSDSSVEAEYSDDIYESMLENHIYDYYSKLYTESTTGLNISETMFPLESDKLFDGEVDPASSIAYESIVQELINRYPASNIIPDVAQEFYRVFKSMRSALYFSSENRYESCVTTQCFQRIFSIPISERDFLLKNNSYKLDNNDIYMSSKMPKITLTAQRTGVRHNALKSITGFDEALDRKAPEKKTKNSMNAEAINTLIEYDKVLDPNKTDVSSFVIEVALLKSSKLV